jgi:hypothetical protein|uniref:Uncharacterized protein n=1 Tax=Siphoviridae sp. ctrCN24 TaxID=2827953 RepID=A0A8S5SLP7_9CAUD|nr:MAG TPA: hypothetical protein [Siphoviridae sp. ctrCN24]
MVKYQDISFTNKQAQDDFKTKWIAADYDTAIAMLSDAALDDKVVDASVFNDLATKIVEAEEREDINFPEHRLGKPSFQVPTSGTKGGLQFVYTNWQNNDFQSVQLYEHDGTQWNPCYFKISPKVQAKIDGQTSDIAELTDLTPSVQTNVLLKDRLNTDIGSAVVDNIGDYSLIVLRTSAGDAVIYLDASSNGGCAYIYNYASQEGQKGYYAYAKRTSTGVDFRTIRVSQSTGVSYAIVYSIYGII